MSRSKPRIGVTGPTRYGRSPAWTATRVALARVGSRAVRLSPHIGLRRFDTLQGIIIGGGADVHPSLYGQPELAQSPQYDQERDAFELEVIRRAWEKGLPLLAICRGMQLLNVSFGGTLDQDIWAGVQGDTRDTLLARHPIAISDGSRLAEAVGAATTRVNRIHRQAVARVGAGLQVTSHGLAEVPQSIEPVDDPRWWLGVQWHPEYLWRRRAHLRIFSRLVRRARLGEAPARAAADETIPRSSSIPTH